MSKGIVFCNHTLAEYQKEYRNRKKLRSYTKEEVRSYDLSHGHYHYEYSKKDYVYDDYLLRNRLWWLIDNTYYEVPKKPSFTWFRNLKVSTQIVTSVLVCAAVSSAVIFPVLAVTVWKGNNVIVPEEVKKYVDIDFGDKVEVGKPLQTEFTLKEEARETKQLPKKLKVVKTGDVILPEYVKPTLNSNIKVNETEPENYYTYTLISKDKADLYIKKVLGPISIEMEVEDRKYTVTFDPNNGEDKQVVEVKKNNKVSKPTDPIKDLCSLKYWSLEDKDEEFSFDTLINEDVSLKAHWIASETGVIVRGINGMANHYSTMQKAFDAGLAIMKTVSDNDLAHGKCTKEVFDNTFTDIRVDEQGNEYATLTWELYTKDGEQLEIPYGVNDTRYFYSFGRKSCGIGENDNLFITDIKMVGVTDNKPSLKLNANNLRQTEQLTMNIKNSSRTDIVNSYTFKNIDIDDRSVNSGNYISNGSSEVSYTNKLDFEHCNIQNRMYIEGGKLDITINNCVFDGKSSSQKYGLYYVGSDIINDDTVKFTNNVVKNYKRGVQLNAKSAGNVLVENNTFIDLNVGKSEKCGVGALQFSGSSNKTVFDVKNNTFNNCNSNCFLVHETCINGATININDNVLENCCYVGCSEPDISQSSPYTLNSSNNIITGTTQKDKCGFDTDELTTPQDLAKHLLVLNEKQ